MNRDSFSHGEDIIEILKGLESKKAEYPPELLAARRKFFIEQLEQHIQLDVVNEPAEKDLQLPGMFQSLKSLEPEYPREMLARRRSLFKQRLQERSRVSVWNALKSTTWKILAGPRTSSRTTVMKFSRASVIAAGVAMVAFVVFALYGNSIQPATPMLPQNEAPVGSAVLTTPTQQAEIICENGYEPPLCLAPELDTSQNLTYAGNGKARPAVAKDTVSEYGQVHRAAYANDGLYGPGASWVSKSSNSWIKIDLGSTAQIDTVTFSRDRLGTLNDGDPGQFVIAVAITDNIYADGNSSNDEREYIAVYDSQRVGFDGIISGPETVIASFNLQRARFIKITFENAGTAIYEVEAFASKPSPSILAATQGSHRDDDETSPRVSTPIPTNTPLPLDTATAVPTDTPVPADTATPLPEDTATPVPVETDTPIPTEVVPLDETRVPTDAATSLPTDSAFPPPVEAPVPVPTQEPTPTDAGVAP